MPTTAREFMSGDNPHGGAFDSFDCLFTHVGTGGGGFVPRAVFADVEPDACHRLQHYSACRSWISPEQVVTFGRESNGVYPKGYSKAEAWKLRNSIRVMLEHMDDACELRRDVRAVRCQRQLPRIDGGVVPARGVQPQRDPRLRWGVETSDLASSNGPLGIYNSAMGLKEHYSGGSRASRPRSPCRTRPCTGTRTGPRTAPAAAASRSATP